jgi:hypothetical protein
MTALRVSERNWIELSQRVRDLEAELAVLYRKYADLLVQLGNVVKP